MYRNLLAGGEPGSGKSSLLNTIIAHAALCTRREAVAVRRQDRRTRAVAPGRRHLRRQRHPRRPRPACASCRPRWTRATGSSTPPAAARSSTPTGSTSSSASSTNSPTSRSPSAPQHEQDEFKTLVRDLVARGRAAGIIIVAATQRPSADIIPTSLRDLFGFRVAFRCTTDSSSDIILSVGWAKEGYSARAIRPEDIGVGLILAEGGIPRRFKAAYLTDAQIRAVIATALRRRGDNPAA